MVIRLQQAFKAETGNTGVIFESADEAHKEEIRFAVECLHGVEKAHLMNVASGYSGCKATRAAILTLAEAIKQHPIDKPKAT